MSHEPAAKAGEDPAAIYKTRLGVWMFLAYLLVYIGFVAINLVNPVLMEQRIIFGLNLAVVYGFFLIIAALLLALIYNRACTRQEMSLAPRAASLQDAPHEPPPGAESEEDR